MEKLKKIGVFFEWIGAMTCILLACVFGFGVHTFAFGLASLLLLPETRIHDFIKEKFKLKDAAMAVIIACFVVVGSVSLIVGAATGESSDTGKSISKNDLSMNVAGIIPKTTTEVAAENTTIAEATTVNVLLTDAVVETTVATTAEITFEVTNVVTTTEATVDETTTATTEATTEETTTATTEATTEETTVVTTTEQTTKETTKATAEKQPEYVSGATYVLNTNTKKFHRMSCSSVDTIKPKNYKESNAGRDVIISQGFVPCKRCDP